MKMKVEYNKNHDDVWIWTRVEEGALINETDWHALVYFIHHNTEWSDKEVQTK